jgi:hypothetical protein
MKRSGFKRRTKPLRASPNEAKAKVKPKKCKACRSPFFPASPMQSHCRAEACAQAAGQEATKRRERREAKEKAVQAKLDKAQREAMKGVPDLKREAQDAFNKFIRLRDRLAGHACICCNRPLRWGVFGGAVDAGHYRSVGSADNLRFNEDNCHAQLSLCNQFGSGRAVDYRIGLIERIGLERVEAIESENKPVKWTRDGLRQIRDTYRAKANELQKKITETC